MYENYVVEFLNKAAEAGDPFGPLSLLFLFLARLFPIIAQAPFLGARVMPHPVKVSLCIALFILFLPHLLETMSGPLAYSNWAVILLAKEFAIGTAIGFFISIPFSIVQNAGIFIDHQRGGASLMVNDPTIQNQSSPLGTLFNFYLIYLFFQLNIPFYFFDLLIDSYTVMPIDQLPAAVFFNLENPFWKEMLVLFNKIMVLSIQMAMPALIMILMTDFFLGIANRLAPQVQITFLGMPLKSLLALLIVCLGWSTYIDKWGQGAKYWLGYISTMINYLKVGRLEG